MTKKSTTRGRTKKTAAKKVGGIRGVIAKIRSTFTTKKKKNKRK